MNNIYKLKSYNLILVFLSQGDSGGPLVTKENNYYVQIGIVSFGSQTCDSYGVFCRVTGSLIIVIIMFCYFCIPITIFCKWFKTNVLPSHSALLFICIDWPSSLVNNLSRFSSEFETCKDLRPLTISNYDSVLLQNDPLLFW